MAAFSILCTAIIAMAGIAASSTAKSNTFASDLKVFNLFVSSPFQANATATYDSTVILTVIDGDYPDVEPVNCEIKWKVGTSPPDQTLHQCSNDSMRVWMPKGTYHGVGNFRLDFAHSVIDTSVGQCPQYCQLTKYAMLNLTASGTPNYNCDIENATCQTTLFTNLTAQVYAAVA